MDIPHTQVRRVTASRLLESKQTAPHFYTTVECNVENLMKIRKEMNAALESSSLSSKLSVNDFIIKAAALVRESFIKCGASFTFSGASLIH